MAIETAEVTVLTEDALRKLLADRQGVSATGPKKCRRKAVRWPFPGTVQLWVNDDAFGERLLLATSLNLSVQGIAVRCDEEVEVGTELTLAVHEPEISFQGRAVVRHCAQNDDEIYCIGLAFLFEQ